MISAMEKNESGRLIGGGVVVKYGTQERAHPESDVFTDTSRNYCCKSCRYSGKEHFWQKEQQVQKSWGGRVSGMFKDLKEDSMAKNPMEWEKEENWLNQRVNRREEGLDPFTLVIIKTLVFSLSVMGIHWRILSTEVTWSDFHYYRITLVSVLCVHWKGEIREIGSQVWEDCNNPGEKWWSMSQTGCSGGRRRRYEGRANRICWWIGYEVREKSNLTPWFFCLFLI